MNIAGWDISLDAATAAVGSRGGALLSWTVPGPDGAPVDLLAGDALLAPWCRTLRHGRYVWHDITYTVRAGQKAALGLLGSVNFELIEQNDASLRLGTVFSSDDYPGVLKIVARYELRQADGGYELALELDARNICSESVPVQLGWRPVIALEGPVQAARLRIPARAHVATDPVGLPLAGMQAFEQLDADGVDIEGPQGLDEAYTDLIARDGTVRVRLGHGSGACTTLAVENPELGRGASLVRVETVAPRRAECTATCLALEYAQGMDDALARPDAERAVGLAPGERRQLRASLVHRF